jgi:hypothetical protein
MVSPISADQAVIITVHLQISFNDLEGVTDNPNNN